MTIGSEEIRPTLSDKLLAATLLKFFPKKVTPNQITIFRFFTIPFVATLFILGEYGWGAVFFIISALTDALDGARARIRNQVTAWGEVHDPLADKLLIGTVAVLVLPKYMSAWIVFMIIGIEMLLIGTVYYLRNKGATQIRANAWGKAKMMFQSIGIGAILMYALGFGSGFFVLGTGALVLAIALALASLVTYSI